MNTLKALMSPSRFVGMVTFVNGKSFPFSEKYKESIIVHLLNRITIIWDELFCFSSFTIIIIGSRVLSIVGSSPPLIYLWAFLSKNTKSRSLLFKVSFYLYPFHLGLVELIFFVGALWGLRSAVDRNCLMILLNKFFPSQITFAFKIICDVTTLSEILSVRLIVCFATTIMSVVNSSLSV